MALVAGNVSISASGSVTKSGAAGRFFDKMVEVFELGDAPAEQQEGAAKLANLCAAWLVVELTEHAVVDGDAIT